MAVVTIATAGVLLAGCSGNDDKPNAKSEGGGSSTATAPSTPGVAAFDPPKAFVPMSAFGIERTAKDNEYTLQAGMVGQNSLIAGLTGVTGRNIAAHGQPWTVPSAAASTTETLDVTAPMGVQLDGKDVVAIAYVRQGGDSVVSQAYDAATGQIVVGVGADGKETSTTTPFTRSTTPAAPSYRPSCRLWTSK